MLKFDLKQNNIIVEKNKWRVIMFKLTYTDEEINIRDI